MESGGATTTAEKVAATTGWAARRIFHRKRATRNCLKPATGNGLENAKSEDGGQPAEPLSIRSAMCSRCITRPQHKPSRHIWSLWHLTGQGITHAA